MTPTRSPGTSPRTTAERERRGVAVVARGEGEHLDAVLALPRDLERATQHGIAPALRHADGHIEPAGGERAKLPPVGGRDVGVGDDQDAVHGGQMRNVNESSTRRATLVWPFRIPHSTFRIGSGP